MLHSATTPAFKRVTLRQRLTAGPILVLPGAFNPLSAMLIEKVGYEAVYVSGAVLAADLGLPDIGLTSVSEVAARSAQIARVSSLPTLVDADTGFGETLNVARTIQLLEDAGVAGVHLEDQENPKRCGHLEGKRVVSEDVALQRIRAAVDARRDPNFLLVARTDARAVDGLAAAIDRAKAYADAGADAVFPEALLDGREFAAMRAAIDVPILANMTEFGVAETLRVEELEELGVNMVIFPVSLLRLAMGITERGLETLRRDGSFAPMIAQMQSRSELYELLDYASFTRFDETVYDFRRH